MLSDIKLANYQIDPVRGFLPAEDPLEQLPSYFTSWEDLAAQVSALLMTGRLRSALDQLPLLDTSRLEDDRQIQRAMLLLSVFGNAYVWAEKPAATSIPPGVAIPWAQVAEKLGRPLIVSNASAL
jgi:indoleamine 2,3-dioxygenase